MLLILAPVYLGWALGANSASNAFGTAVSSRMLRFTTAASLASVFVILGAVLEGDAGMHTLSSLASFDTPTAVLSSIAAAVSVTILTILRLPVSASQAVVGAILGATAFRGDVPLQGMGKVVACWLGTPLGSLVAAVVLYVVLSPVFNRIGTRLITYDFVMRLCLLAVVCYGAYAVGANNVANVTGVFVGAGVFTPFEASVLGGASIGLGIMTYSKRVMLKVGRGIIRLNAYGAFIASFASALTVHAYAIVGVPVSSSQAIVGAVLGIGVLKSVETIRYRAVLGILSGWFATPLLAMTCAIGIRVLAQWLSIA